MAAMECGVVSFYTNEWEDHSNNLEPPSPWSFDSALDLGTWGFPGGSDSKVFACNAEDPGSIPESGRSPREGNGNPLQYSCLENFMDRGAWWDTVHGVAKSQTQLRDFHFTWN